MSEDSEKLDQQQNQSQTGTEQPDDAITLLAAELKEIRQALGIGSDVANSSLLKRLETIEQKLSKPQEQRNLPESISWEQAGNLSFMRKHGISLDDISAGRIQVVRD
jgi:hypothetical protein